MKSLYDILLIQEAATQEQINKAYKKLAMQYHPDKCVANSPEEKEKITARFQTIVDAYTRLSDIKSREVYDQVQALRRFNQPLEPVELAGYITSPRAPFSVIFKKTHLGITEKATSFPKRTSVGSHQKIDFFDRIKNETQKEPIVFVQAIFTPGFVLQIFQQFLRNEYRDVEYFRVKNYMQNQLEQFANFNSQRKLTLGFYQGINDIIAMQFDSSSSHKIYSSLQNILAFVQKKAEIAPEQEMKHFFTLFAMQEFRELMRYGLDQFWETKSAPDLLSCFSSSMDQILELDVQGEKSSYLHLLYNVQKQLQKRYIEAEHNADALRKLAFDCLDYTHIINADKAVVINHFLISCALFQKASYIETRPNFSMADEMILIQISLICMRMAREAEAFIDIYAHQHIIAFINNLRFDHPHLSELQKALRQHMFGLVDVFPYLQNMKSHLNLRHELSLPYLQKYLKTLTQNECPEYASADTHYQAFAAQIDGWYPEQPQPELENADRLKTMGHFLSDNGWTFHDMEKNLNTLVMVNRDDEGWLIPGALPFMKGMNTYKSFDGLSIDFQKGELIFARKQYQSGEPAYLQTFTDYDMMEIFERGIDSAVFSLDPLDPEKPYHPLQTMRYKPSRLVNSEFLSTLFFTDYLLKFFTTGYEVMGKFPYSVRPIDKLIENLPVHLKKIITDFHANNTKNKVHRFWIEANLLPALEESMEEGLRLTFGSVKMHVKKHRMTIDQSGNLIDSKQDAEGWNIYRLPNMCKLTNLQKFQAPAMIFIEDQNQIFYYENQQLSKPVPITLESAVWIQLKSQPVTDTMLLKPGTDKNSACQHFIYQLTLQVCEKAKIAHRFSAEHIFAEEFTAHYEEFARYFPEFARLQQLSCIVAASGLLKNVYENNNDKILEMQRTAKDEQFWIAIKSNLYQKIFDAEKIDLMKIKQNLDAVVQKNRQYQTQQLQEIRNQIGSFSLFHASSPEVLGVYNSLVEENRIRITNEKGAHIWGQVKSSIESQARNHIPQIVQDLNAAIPGKKANYKTQLSKLLPAAPASSLDSFLDGNMQVLVEFLVSKNKEENIQHIITIHAAIGSADELKSLCNGNPEPLARNIAERQSSIFLQKQKITFLQSIEGRKKLKENFESLNIHVKHEDKEGSGYCNFVPASIHHEKNRFVYGGDVVVLSVSTQIEAQKHISNLNFPQQSIFKSAQNIEIQNAKNFVSGLRRQASQLPLILGISTLFSVNALANDVDRAISNAEFKQSLTKTHEDFGFRHISTPDMPLADLFSGRIHKTAYKIFPHDSLQCAILKGEANNIFADESVEGGSWANAMRSLRAGTAIERIEKQIPKECKPATKEDLDKMANNKDKSFFMMTPKDIGLFFQSKRNAVKDKEEKIPAKLGITGFRF